MNRPAARAWFKMAKEKILIIDFGSQYNQLIARKVRENNVFCEIVPPTIDTRSINRINGRLTKRSITGHLIDRAGYMILSFVALWASARFSEWSVQFLVLAGILGMKWVLDSHDQVIQIFTHE